MRLVPRNRSWEATIMTWDEAAKIVGEEPADNYQLDLAAHTAAYATSAPQLSILLNDPQVTAIRDQYREGDQAAIAAQTRYKDTMKQANRAILAAAVLSALTMAGPDRLRRIDGQSVHRGRAGCTVRGER